MANFFNHKYPYTDFHELNLDWFLAEFKKLIDELDALKVRMTNAEADIDTLQAQMTNVMQRITSLESDVTDIFEHLDNIDEVQARILTDLSEQLNRIISIEGDVSNIEINVDNINTSIESLDNAIGLVEEGLSNLTSRVTDVESNISDINNTLDDVEDNISDINDTLNNVDTLLIGSVSGAIASFDGVGDTIPKNLLVDIQATQSGSGTPSPTNVRPITGFTECTVTDTNDTDTNTATISFGSAGTVYGGTVDLTSGTLTVDRGYLQPSTVIDIATSSGIVYWIVANNLTSINGVDGLISSHFEPASGVVEGHCYITGNGIILVAVPTDQTLNTVELANAWLSENQPQFVYKLTSNQTYQLTPDDLDILQGINNVSANTGIIIDLTYFKSKLISDVYKDLLTLQRV